MPSLRNKTIIGVAWNFAEQMLGRGIGIAVTLLLAWFLVPENYGLVAMMAVFLALSTALVDAGFSEALIRKLEVTELDLNTVFYTNLILSALIYSVLFFTAPFVATFYDQPLLIDLIRVAGMSVFFSALIVVQKSVLNRQLKFKLMLKVSLPAAVISGLIAIALAYFDYGVWALVWQMVISSILTAIFFWRLKLWRPKLIFSLESLKELFGFSSYAIVDRLFSVPFKNMYIIVIAKYFSAGIAGLYFFAEKIKDLIVSQLVQSIQNVTYPALSQLQEDNERLKQGYRKVIAMMTFMLFPALVFLAALSEPLFRFLLPEQWLDAVPYLQLMCIAALLYPLHSINLNILKVKGRSDLVLYVGIYKKAVAIGIFIVTLPYGIIAILLGQILSSILAFLPNTYFSSRLIGYSVKEQLADFIPGLVLSAAIAGLIFGLQAWAQWWAFAELVVFGLLAGLLYLIGAHLLKLHAYELTKELVLKKFKKV